MNKTRLNSIILLI